MSKLSPHVPKFGDWDVDEENGEKQAFTLIFDNMRADKSLKTSMNPNDPAFLASFLGSSSSSQAVAPVHDVDQHQRPPPSVHESVSPLTPTPILDSANHKALSSGVPKFGDWDVDGGNGEQQAYTLIFNNMHVDKSKKRVNPNDPAFLASFFNSSSASTSSSQSPPVHDVDRHQHPVSLLKGISPPVPTNHKHVTAPKFGDWDMNNRKESTVILDDLKEEKQNRNQTAQKRTEKRATPTLPVSTHKPFWVVNWRLCFNSNHAVRD